MAEVARRFREASGSDVVRRLIARPIRLDPPASVAASRSCAMRLSDPVEDRDQIAVADADQHIVAMEHTRIEDETFEDAAFADEAPDDVVDRLHAEMAVMKAILKAERAEAAALRTRIAQQGEPEPTCAEARATRDRWAGMVDRLLLSQP